MKFINRILAILFLLTSNCAFASICATDKNIKDYFLSVPSEELKIVDDIKGYLKTKEDRSNAIDYLDVKNGFLSLQNKTILSFTEAVLFKTNEGKPVIAVTSNGASVQNVYAFVCYNEQWHDIKSIIFPEVSIEKVSDLYANKKIPLNRNLVKASELAKVPHTLIRYKLSKIEKTILVYASHPELLNTENYLLYEYSPSLNKILKQIN